jgi:hypothetical protein
VQSRLATLIKFIERNPPQKAKNPGRPFGLQKNTRYLFMIINVPKS